MSGTAAHRPRLGMAEFELFDVEPRMSCWTPLQSFVVAPVTKMKRKLNQDDVPEPVNSNTGFGNLGLDTRLLQAVNRDKFATPSSIQQKAIPLALQGKDVLGRSLHRRMTASANVLQHAPKLALVKRSPTCSPSSTPSSNAKPLRKPPSRHPHFYLSRQKSSLTRPPPLPSPLPPSAARMCGLRTSHGRKMLQSHERGLSKDRTSLLQRPVE